MDVCQEILQQEGGRKKGSGKTSNQRLSLTFEQRNVPSTLTEQEKRTDLSFSLIMDNCQ